MVGQLLSRGLLAGAFAGVLASLFAFVASQPSIERAIAFESAAAQTAGAAEPAIVSRAVQRTPGLLAAAVIYGAALGGFFAIAFAFANGRIGALQPRAVAALLAVAGFVAVALVPALKYPPNPPAIGQPETIGLRTALYFSMLFASILTFILASLLRNALAPRIGGWNAGLAAAFVLVLALAVVGLELPPIDEVPDNFPATLLWRFRLASLGAQAVLWAALGLSFGALAQALDFGAPARNWRAANSGAR